MLELKGYHMPEELSGPRATCLQTVRDSTSSGRAVATVKVRALQSHVSLGHLEEDIPEHEAICRFCFDASKQENLVKMECECRLSLAHELCAAEWTKKKGNNNCEVCEETVQLTSVILELMQNSGTGILDNKHQKRNFLSSKVSFASWVHKKTRRYQLPIMQFHPRVQQHFGMISHSVRGVIITFSRLFYVTIILYIRD